MRFIYTLILACSLPTGWLRADALTLGPTNAASGAILQLPFTFTNTNQIVGMQFDLKFPASQMDVGAATALSTTTDHTAESREVTTGTRRIILYSAFNQLLPSDLVLEVPLTLKSGIPQGGPTVNVSNIILTNKQGETFSPTINRPLFDTWRLSNFSEAELNNPAIVGDDRDPDGDGLVNLLEFLMGGNPRLRQSTHDRQVGYDIDPADNKPYLTMLFRVGKNASAGTLSVQASRDLSNWNSTGIILTPTGVEDADSIEYEAAIQVNGINRQFLRLIGTRNAGN